MGDQSPETIQKQIRNLGRGESKTIRESKDALVAAGASAVPYLLNLALAWMLLLDGW